MSCKYCYVFYFQQVQLVICVVQNLVPCVCHALFVTVLVISGSFLVAWIQSNLTKRRYCKSRVSEEAAHGRAACPPVLWHVP